MMLQVRWMVTVSHKVESGGSRGGQEQMEAIEKDMLEEL